MKFKRSPAPVPTIESKSVTPEHQDYEPSQTSELDPRILSATQGELERAKSLSPEVTHLGQTAMDGTVESHAMPSDVMTQARWNQFAPFQPNRGVPGGDLRK